jgi:hypothetical protein
LAALYTFLSELFTINRPWYQQSRGMFLYTFRTE